MKTIRLLAVACALAGVSSAFAGTITFEGAPTGVDLDSYYSGVTFGTGDQATQQVLPFFPAHSGSEILDNVNSPSITFTFATSQSSFSLYYITAFGFTATATLANGTVETLPNGSSAGYNSAALLGNPASYSVNTLYSQVNTSGNSANNFVSVTLTDDTTILDGEITIDDLTAPGVSGLPAPDATSTLGLLGVGVAGLLVFRRKFATRQ